MKEKNSFRKKVWQKLLQIPRGRVTTYSDIARALKNPRAYRAVGNACNQNPHAPRIPCHRVVAKNGKIGGYAHGTAAKIRLLSRESIRVKNNRVENFAQMRFLFPRQNTK